MLLCTDFPGRGSPEPPGGRLSASWPLGQRPCPPDEAAAVCHRPRWHQKPFTVRPIGSLWLDEAVQLCLPAEDRPAGVPAVLLEAQQPGALPEAEQGFLPGLCDLEGVWPTLAAGRVEDGWGCLVEAILEAWDGGPCRRPMLAQGRGVEGVKWLEVICLGG